MSDHGTAHDPEDENCACFCCANARRIDAAARRRMEERVAARGTAPGCIIRLLEKPEDQRYGVYEIERYGQKARGRIDDLMMPGSHDYVVEPFMLLNPSQRYDVILEASTRPEVSLVSMWDRWDHEEEVAKATGGR